MFYVPLLMFDAEETGEDFTERSDVVEVVEDDDARQFTGAVFALVRDVRQVLPQFLPRFVIDVERCR